MGRFETLKGRGRRIIVTFIFRFMGEGSRSRKVLLPIFLKNGRFGLY